MVAKKRTVTYETRRRKLAIAVGLLSLFGNLLCRLFWPQHSLRELRELALILTEGALVASLIGLLIEVSHLSHLFEDQLARALVRLDFLRRLTEGTLDEISKKSYFVRNEKAVDNPNHHWQEYFEEIWRVFAPLPTAEHRRDNTIHIRIEHFDDEEEIARLVRRSAGIPPLLRVTETVDYRLVAPRSDCETVLSVRSIDQVDLHETIEQLLENGCCLSYQVLIDGNEIDVSKAVTIKRTDSETVDGNLNYVGKYRASALIKMVRTTVEPGAGNFFSISFREPARGLAVTCVSDRPRKWVYEVFASNKKSLSVQVDSPSTLQFRLDGWLHPNEGFIVVPLRLTGRLEGTPDSATLEKESSSKSMQSPDS